MTKQIDIIAWLHIAYGVLILLLAFVVTGAVIGGGLISGEREAIAVTTTVGIVLGIVFVVLALPSLIGGWGLLNRRSWARTLIIVLSVIDLFSFPIGTAIGGYSLWVLFQDEARAEFEVNPY
ncbi:MAG TPA: hypothetical protein VFG50_03175 [Rhodothermales bacterium]|nr:hypothetical protein [Rhodothermales bacterium]